LSLSTVYHQPVVYARCTVVCCKKTAYCSQNTLSSSYVRRMSSWITCIIKL